MQTREQQLRSEDRAVITKLNFEPQHTLMFKQLVKEAHQKREELIQEASARRRQAIAIEQLNRELRRDMSVAQKIVVIVIGLICLYLAFTL